MKTILRKFAYAALALYITSLWNLGFIIPHNLPDFLKATLILMVIFYLVVPVTKLVLLPLNILTLGLVSFVAYMILFYVFTQIGHYVQIKEWVFYGINFFGLSIPKIPLSFIMNLALSSLSVSVIINVLEE